MSDKIFDSTFIFFYVEVRKLKSQLFSENMGSQFPHFHIEKNKGIVKNFI